MALRAQELIESPPHLHGFDAAGRPESWALSPETLRLLDDAIEPGSRTLETGAGVSTVLFALREADHVCVAPAEDEVRRIREFCAANGISTERVSFVVERSELALPRFEPTALDLVLIDGSHSFPNVFIDWHYTAARLRLGGLLFVDDINLWTPRVLHDFLREDPSWALDAEVPMRSAVFRKQLAVDGAANWTEQPFVVARSHLTRGSRAMAMLRQGQLRTLLRRLRPR